MTNAQWALPSPAGVSVPHLLSAASTETGNRGTIPLANPGSCYTLATPVLELGSGHPTLGSTHLSIPHLGLKEALGPLDALGGDINLGEAGQHV